MNTPKTNLIKCPNCNAQYLAQEIFVKKALTGTAKNIVKTPEGIIIGFTGDDIDLTESFICDFCNNPFNVRGNFIWDIDKNITLEEAFNK